MRHLDIAPLSLSHDGSDRAGTDMTPIGQDVSGDRFVFGSDHFDSGGGELDMSAASHVDRMCHGFEMVGIDTRPIATQVVNFTPLGDRPLVSFVGKTVSQDGLPVTRPHSISLGSYGSFPRPASCQGGYLVIKRRVFAIAMTGPIANRHASDLSFFGIVSLGNVRHLAAATLTHARRIRSLGGIVGLHVSDLLHRSGGAVARDVCSVAGLFSCLNYTIPGHFVVLGG